MQQKTTVLELGDTSESTPSERTHRDPSGGASSEARRSRRTSRQSLGMLVCIVLLGLALRLAFLTGVSGGDDVLYIFDAIELAEGRFIPHYQHWQARCGLTGLLAIAWKLFPPGMAVVAVIPLLWSLANICLAYATGRIVYGKDSVGLLAALLVATFPMEVIKATQYFAVTGIATWTWTAFLLFYIAYRDGPGSFYYLSGIALGVAYTYRITALFYVLPLMLFIVLCRRWRIGFLLAAAGLATVLLAESVVFAMLFDDPLYRFYALTHYTASVDQAAEPASVMMRRDVILYLVFGPLKMLAFNQEFGLCYYFVAGAVIYLIMRRDRLSYPLLLCFLAVAGYTMWGTVRPNYYHPLGQWPRFMSIATIPAVVLLARSLCYWRSSAWRMAAVSVLVMSSLVCVVVDNSRTYGSLGRQLLAIHEQNDERSMAVHGLAFVAMFTSNGFQVPPNVEIVGQHYLHHAQKVAPQLVIRPDDYPFRDCYVVLPEGYVNGIPDHWEKQVMVRRKQHSFVKHLAGAGSFGKRLADRLSSDFVFEVFYVPSEETEAGKRDTAELRMICQQGLGVESAGGTADGPDNPYERHNLHDAPLFTQYSTAGGNCGRVGLRRVIKMNDPAPKRTEYAPAKRSLKATRSNTPQPELTLPSLTLPSLTLPDSVHQLGSVFCQPSATCLRIERGWSSGWFLSHGTASRQNFPIANFSFLMRSLLPPEAKPYGRQV